MPLLLMTLFSGLLPFIHPIDIDDVVIPEIEIKENVYHVKQSNLQEKVAVIIEVDGDPEKHKTYIENHFPSIDVVMTYSLLFNGLALKGSAARLSKLKGLPFIVGFHPVQTYEIKEQKLNDKANEFNKFSHFNIPFELNRTPFTGKGIKVGVIDTGIAMSHPDLKQNYRGGYDVVDLDDIPMETTQEQGIPTNHGTHVAGIIGANGRLKGVAPNSDIYAYRALGPGGIGTSIHVIAALEEAVKDGVHIINLSLGNDVNGPDYPTSRAVNEAYKQGVIVVVANGNAGPTQWTVGSPATAYHALSVGAYQYAENVRYLYEPKSKVKMPFSILNLNNKNNLKKRSYDIVSAKKSRKQTGNIVYIDETGEGVIEQIEQADEKMAAAVIISLKDSHEQTYLLEKAVHSITMPVLYLNRDGDDWLRNQLQKSERIYIKSEIERVDEQIASFSSRGPVTENWLIKPDIVAPGVHIMSTVPEGYDLFNGTSMASPYVAGALALMKEAHPSWTNEQLIGALKTTANTLHDATGEKIQPIAQGMGLIQIEEAINAETIIHNPTISYGKVNEHIKQKTSTLQLENMSDYKKKYHFTIPKKVKGLTWNMPLAFELDPGETKTIPINLKMNSLQLDEGLHQGWLTLHSDDKQYQLPYMFINQHADNPKLMGFSFQLNPYGKDIYTYEMYVPEAVQSIHVQLYNPHSLVYEGELWRWNDLQVGMNKGDILARRIKQRGHFYGLIIVHSKNGDIYNYETEIFIE